MPEMLATQVGFTYGRLTVVAELPNSSVGEGRLVECRCACGTTRTLPLKRLRNGTTSSCGCLRREMVASKNHRHGGASRGRNRRPEYVAWKRMRQRCNDPNTHEWSRYGGRGITVDKSWDDFSVFLRDVGPKPTAKHSLERIDNDKGYCPGNVVWATPSQQARNKRNTFSVIYQGVRVAVADLADTHGLPYSRLYNRIRKGWPIEKALTTERQGAIK